MKQKNQSDLAENFQMGDEWSNEQPQFSDSEKIGWYGQLLYALNLMEEKDSPKYQQLISDKEEIENLITMIDDFIRVDAHDLMKNVAADYKKGIDSFLKQHKSTLTKVAHTRITELLTDYLDNVKDIIEETTIEQNPLAYNASLLAEVIELPEQLPQELKTLVNKALDVAAGNIIEQCEHYEQEVKDSAIQSLRCSWINLLFIEHHEAINFVWGQWRFNKALNNFTQKLETLPAPDGEFSSAKDQRMFLDLMLTAAKNMPDGMCQEFENACDCCEDDCEQGCCD